MKSEAWIKGRLGLIEMQLNRTIKEYDECYLAFMDEYYRNMIDRMVTEINLLKEVLKDAE